MSFSVRLFDFFKQKSRPNLIFRLLELGMRSYFQHCYFHINTGVFKKLKCAETASDLLQ